MKSSEWDREWDEIDDDCLIGTTSFTQPKLKVFTLHVLFVGKTNTVVRVYFYSIYYFCFGERKKKRSFCRSIFAMYGYVLMWCSYF